jgi:hypothetical protein
LAAGAGAGEAASSSSELEYSRLEGMLIVGTLACEDERGMQWSGRREAWLMTDERRAALCAASALTAKWAACSASTRAWSRVD